MEKVVSRTISGDSFSDGVPRITTDGFEFYSNIVRHVMGAACQYGQVIKTRRNDRVVRVERWVRIGASWGWKQAWRNSQDSTLTIRPSNKGIPLAA